jgi:hypothetical protein
MARLYPSAWARLRRLRGVLPDIERVCFAIRAPSLWWGAALEGLGAAGDARPRADVLASMARGRRGWRDVIEDVADALPRARIEVWTYESLCERPAEVAAWLLGRGPEPEAAPVRPAAKRPSPFDPDAQAAMDAAHEDDLAWLRSGAGGLVHFVSDRPTGPDPDEEGVRDDRDGDRPGPLDAAR